MTDSAQGSGGRGDAETKQPLFYAPSPLNVFGVDPKHFQKWLQVWDERRTFNDVQPSPDHPKKLNCVSPDFVLRAGRSKQWRSRVVVLRGHFLYYFRYPVKPNHTCRGVVLVKGCAVTTFQSFEGKANVVMIGPNTTRKPGWRPDLTRRFYFSLSSPAELKKWYQMLKLAAHTEKTYNKYMVKTITVPATPPPAPPTQQAAATKDAKASAGKQEQTVDSDPRPVQHNNAEGQSPPPQQQKKRANSKKKTSSGERSATADGASGKVSDAGGQTYDAAAEQAATNQPDPIDSSKDKSKKKKKKSKRKQTDDVNEAKEVPNES